MELEVDRLGKLAMLELDAEFKAKMTREVARITEWMKCIQEVEDDRQREEMKSPLPEGMKLEIRQELMQEQQRDSMQEEKDPALLRSQVEKIIGNAKRTEFDFVVAPRVKPDFE